MEDILVTVIEHAHYIKKAERLLTKEQLAEIVDILAVSPEAGDIMPGTGGFRKMRYAGTQGKGKSGGLRIIYFFIVNDEEIHLLDIFGKGEKANLTKAERNELAKIAALLKGA